MDKKCNFNDNRKKTGNILIYGRAICYGFALVRICVRSAGGRSRTRQIKVNRLPVLVPVILIVW